LVDRHDEATRRSVGYGESLTFLDPLKQSIKVFLKLLHSKFFFSQFHRALIDVYTLYQESGPQSTPSQQEI